MTTLIYQVYVGPKSKLYDTCTESVKAYADKIGADYICQTEPKLMMKPNPFTSNRSEGASRLGYLPIYEKENAFDYLDKYDKIAIIDSDVYIRENAANVFDSLSDDAAIAASLESNMPITDTYVKKIQNYSRMQYSSLYPSTMLTDRGYPFANMGVMILNSKNFKPYLNGQNAKQFLMRNEFRDFIDGKGPWKWSTDQTLLNQWIWKYQIPFQDLDWRYNGLYSANTKIEECHFIHFFLKDLLSGKGENINEMLKGI